MESWNLNFKNWGLRRARRLVSTPAKESRWEMDVVWVHGYTQFGFQPGNGSLRMGVVFKWVLMCAYAMSGLHWKKTSCWRNGVRLLQVAEIGEGREAWEEGWRTHTKALKKQARQHRSCRLQASEERTRNQQRKGEMQLQRKVEMQLQGKGEMQLQGWGRCSFRGRGRCSFRGRGRCSFRGRGRCSFRGRGRDRRQDVHCNCHLH